MTGATQRRLVRFEGEGAGEDELSWGQREMWSAMQRQDTWLPIGGTFAARPGATLDDLADELRFNVSRHPSLRTRLRFTADGSVRQVVAASGEIALDVYDADGGRDPAELAEAVRLRYWHTDFDFVNEWPMRMAVVRCDGRPAYVVAVAHHLVTDGFGATAMDAGAAAQDPATGEAPAPVCGAQPLDQVRWQRSPAGRRQTEHALRYWENLLRTIPPHRFVDIGDEREPRFWEATFASDALYLATQVIAERTRSGTSPVLLALYAVAVARVLRVDPVVVQVVVNNRFRPGLDGVLCPLSQTALCVLDVADRTVDDVVTWARRHTMGAYKHAYYDPDRLDELIGRVTRERGDGLDVGSFFNDRRVRARSGPPGSVPTMRQVREALPATTFAWARRQHQPFERLFVHVEDATDTALVTIAGDTRFVAPERMRACAYGMQTVAVEAAGDPATRTGIGTALTDV